MKMGTLGKVVFTVLLALVLAPQTRAQAPTADSSPAATGNLPAASSSPVTGDWKAVVTRDNGPIHVILHIAADKTGILLATIDAIEMQASDVPVSNMVLKDAKLTFDVDEAPGSYAGTLNKDGTEIDGTWTEENSNAVPMDFTKVTAPAAASTPAQTAPAETAPAAAAQPAASPQQ